MELHADPRPAVIARAKSSKDDLRNEMISDLESLFNQSWGTLTSCLLGSPERDDPLAFLSTDRRSQIPVKKELERIAVETIGEKGRAFVEKLTD